MQHIISVTLLVCALIIPNWSNASEQSKLREKMDKSFTVSELNEYCKIDAHYDQRGFCKGFMDGLFTQRMVNCLALRGAYKELKSEDDKALISNISRAIANDPKGAAFTELLKAFQDWVYANPDALNEDTVILSYNSSDTHFLDAWPCDLDKN